MKIVLIFAAISLLTGRANASDCGPEPSVRSQSELSAHRRWCSCIGSVMDSNPSSPRYGLCRDTVKRGSTRKGSLGPVAPPGSSGAALQREGVTMYMNALQLMNQPKDTGDSEVYLQERRRKREAEQRALDERAGELASEMRGVEGSEASFRDDAQEVGESDSESELEREMRGLGDNIAVDAYNKGESDALRCLSSNGGVFCLQLPIDQQGDCFSNYKLGYKMGEQKRRALLDEAREAGRAARKANKPRSVGNSDPRATGDCRYEWTQAFGQGYMGTVR